MQEIFEYIGNWGRYQLILYVLVSIPFMMSCCEVLIMVFTAGMPNVRCFIPGLDDDNRSINASHTNQYLLPFTLNVSSLLFPNPVDLSGSVTYCTYCSQYMKKEGSLNFTCTDDVATKCDRFVYDTTEFKTTLVSENKKQNKQSGHFRSNGESVELESEKSCVRAQQRVAFFNMVCDNYYKVHLLSTIFMSGSFLGLIAFGSIGDWYGRRIGLLIACCGQMIAFNTAPLLTNYYLFSVSRFFLGAFETGAYLSGFTIVMELFNGTAAVIFGVSTHINYALGYGVIGLLAYFIRDWKTLNWTVSSLTILYIPLFWFAPESIRWLVIKKRIREAEKIVLTAAKMNGVDIPQDVLKRDLEITKEVNKGSALDLFRSGEYACVNIAIFYLWMATSVVYIGISMNTSLLPGNIYVNFTLSALGEILGYILCMPLMELLGRRKSFVIFLCVGGFCVISLCFFKNSIAVTLLTLASKLGVSAAYAVTCNYTAELYPTVVRNIATGYGFSMGCLGAMISPQIALLARYVHYWVPFAIFGCFLLLAAIAIYFLPETKGHEMMDTMEHGKKFIRSQRGNSCTSADDDNSTPFDNRTSVSRV